MSSWDTTAALEGLCVDAGEGSVEGMAGLDASGGTVHAPTPTNSPRYVTRIAPAYWGEVTAALRRQST